MSTLTLIPAYGRDYKSAKAVIEHWNADRDFVVCDHFSQWNGKAANRQSCIEAGITSVRIRYNKLTKVVNILVVSDD